MKIRKARLEEISEIMEIYEKAKKFMQAHGNPTQWQEGYPSLELVEGDCKKEQLYICEDLGKIAGVFMYDTEPDPTYRKIYEGNWINEEPYGTMHRMASSGLVKGVSAFCLQWCFEQCKNLRGDTHRDNIVMQNVFEKNGFQKCGIIYVEDGSERIAYQKIGQGGWNHGITRKK